MIKSNQYLDLTFSSRSRFEERICETGMWFDHIFNFSIYSISAYEVDPSGLYFIHTWYRLKKNLIFYSTIIFSKKKIWNIHACPDIEIPTVISEPWVLYAWNGHTYFEKSFKIWFFFDTWDV